MKRILLLTLLFLGLFIGMGVVKPNRVFAASCHETSTTDPSLTDAFNSCLGAGGKYCGVNSATNNVVCCDSGIACPTTTSIAPQSTPGILGGPCRTGFFDTRCDSNLACINNVCTSCPGATGNEQVCNAPTTPGGGSGSDAGDSIGGSCGAESVDTAIGCIPYGNQSALIGFFLKWGIGIGGGIAFLLILVAGFQIMSSRGDPNRLKAGQELMTSAIAGLLLLIFSLVILRILGFDILGIAAFK